jgi:ribonucleoside-diphosphate reductase alpha chain
MLKYSRRKKINPSDINVKPDYVDALGDKWQMFDVFHHGFKTWMEVTGKTWENLEESPYFGATSADVDWMASVKIQAAAQKWICHSISKTCNLPNSATKELVGQVYLSAWEEGCKGFTVYRDGCRDGVLVSSTPKAEKVVVKGNNAKKRPVNLECDIHHVNISGEAWTILIGLDDETGMPYEIFGGKSSKISLPKKHKKGITRKGAKNKDGNSAYDLIIGQGDEQIVVRDIATAFENPTQGDFTRAFSLMLRHDIAIHFIVDQMQKDEHSELYSFSRVIARVLKKYIKDGTKIKQKCSNCGSEELAYIEGCLTCQSCGNSKCS